MKMDLTKELLLNKIKERESLKNCCIQKWASENEIKHWEKGILEYDKEIIQLCLVLGENEYTLLQSLKDN